MDTKTQLRREAKEIRKTLDMKSLSLELTAKLREQEYYKAAKNVMIYHPLPNEVDVLGLLEDEKNFCLPRQAESAPKIMSSTRVSLEVCPYKKGDRLKISCFNVPEPCTAAIDTDNLDLVIVPALMADKNNYRLGYGGGFYDSFLAAAAGLKSVVLLPEALITEALPIEPHDIKINYIIS